MSFDPQSRQRVPKFSSDGVAIEEVDVYCFLGGMIKKAGSA